MGKKFYDLCPQEVKNILKILGIYDDFYTCIKYLLIKIGVENLCYDITHFKKDISVDEMIDNYIIMQNTSILTSLYANSCTLLECNEYIKEMAEKLCRGFNGDINGDFFYLYRLKQGYDLTKRDLMKWKSVM